ncbi:MULTISPECIES: hypothetical protein [Sphingobium]|uniref:Uncharacterized protein n=1 Tax=Sphingobium cupriresistens TaxID=1132417 RepID=A0A8G1ZJ85_9SPHN|nr:MULTISPECIES: hypothetical protein [Sphingobium]RYM14218.1 hypothetical protein EWH12_03375 [Sphingobium cupriresistens]WCP13942.1 hypothetical protein sphantq_02381 [Sphingobium sp. AntQ-1]
MIGELRLLGLAHGLLLGLLLACSWQVPDLLPWGIDALLLVGGFQLRLADRRIIPRPGAREWISHIRMAPTRLIRWGAAAVIALIAGHADLAIAILLAALTCELLAYPLTTRLLGRVPLAPAAAILMLLVAALGLPGPATLHFILGFLTGVTAAIVWLRGPDGEPRALAAVLGGSAAAVATAVIFPGILAFAAPTLTVCAAWTLAYLSLLRRPVTPWRLGAPPLRLRPSAIRRPLS